MGMPGGGVGPPHPPPEGFGGSCTTLGGGSALKDAGGGAAAATAALHYVTARHCITLAVAPPNLVRSGGRDWPPDTSTSPFPLYFVNNNCPPHRLSVGTHAYPKVLRRTSQPPPPTMRLVTGSGTGVCLRRCTPHSPVAGLLATGLGSRYTCTHLQLKSVRKKEAWFQPRPGGTFGLKKKH